MQLSAFDEDGGGDVVDRDAFYFRATVDSGGGGGGSQLYKFDIAFVTLRVRAVRNVPVRMMNIRETVITDTHLLYQTFPKRTEDSKLFYLLEAAPKQGALLLSFADFSRSPSQPRRLKVGSRFSQADLMSGHLKYRLNRKEYSPVEDHFTFVVQTERGLKSALQTFKVHYVPGDADVDITLESLEVEEGAKKAITNKYLDIRASDGRHFVFNVTRTPLHGQIDVLASNKVDVMRSNTSFFTSSEISEDRVVYKHDDSESRRDVFHFVATSDYSYSVRSASSDFQYLAVFHIHVILRNDQTPTRVVDKVFHVVEGGQKLLTGDDLRFVDLDIDTRPEDIRYNHHAIPNGELVLVENPSQPIFQFTQRDLDDERILFRHLGSNFGRIMLWVSDGQYFVSTELKVRASPPFVRVGNNSGLIVQRGESGFLTVANLSVETNLNVRGKGIRFRVLDPPAFGEILKDDVPVKKFNELDLREEKVEYRNDEDPSDVNRATTKDSMKFSVEVSGDPEGARAEGQFVFHIFSESYWDPLVIVSNNSLLVEESTSIAITKFDLQVSEYYYAGIVLSVIGRGNAKQTRYSRPADRNRGALGSSRNWIKSASDCSSNLVFFLFLQVQAASSSVGFPAVDSDTTSLSPKDIIYMVTTSPRFGYLEIDPPAAFSGEEVGGAERKAAAAAAAKVFSTGKAAYPSSPYEVLIKSNLFTTTAKFTHALCFRSPCSTNL